MKKVNPEKNYEDVVWHVLNSIKEQLIFDLENRRIVDYTFNLNIKRRTWPSFMEERNVIQQLKNQKIIFQIGEAVIVESGDKGTPAYEVHELYHYNVADSFDGYYDKFQVKQNIDGGRWCWFDNNTFFLSLRDNSVKAISFDTERGKHQMTALFQALLEHWKKYEDGSISGKEIVEAMVRFGSKVNAVQLKNIISNIRNKKIKPAGLEDKIYIKFDRKVDGWRIDIKR